MSRIIVVELLLTSMSIFISIPKNDNSRVPEGVIFLNGVKVALNNRCHPIRGFVLFTSGSTGQLNMNDCGTS
ncbi:MAG: hypothetical protein WA364_20560 [Candidatus Nitrosopolaris sp.]